MRTILLGFDAFSPSLFENLSNEGKLPNLTKYSESGRYSRFAVTNPAQSEVSWTSIATGLNPGGHGIFDFVHHDPSSYTPYVSLLPTKTSIVGTQFTPPFTANTIFDEAVRQGFSATALWWPARFPARPESPVRTLPGLGTPDIQGRMGVGAFFSTDRDVVAALDKTTGEVLTKVGKDRFTGSLKGPSQQKRGQVKTAEIEIELNLIDDRSARLHLGNQTVELSLDEWSPVLEIQFKLGLLVKVHAITRVILTQIAPEPKLYFLPLQIHPLHSPWRYGVPGGFVKKLWKSTGPFLTLGWPQDTTALEEGCISDKQFLNLCGSILAIRERILMNLLDEFREGILSTVFDSLDRVQHMFWRRRPDIVEQWYTKLDDLVGRVENRLAASNHGNVRFVIASDHGFSDFDYKVHLNRWLLEQGYLKAKSDDGEAGLRQIDWAQSKLYAVGLNSVYINQSGREGQGSVGESESEKLIDRLRTDLARWKGPDNKPVIQEIASRNEILEGPMTPYGPDILIGYSPGYQGSAETGLGKWKERSIEPNADYWNADHCIDPESVPGVLFANEGLENFPSPTYKDIPALTVASDIKQNGRGTPPPSYSNEDTEIVEERLKGLGYL